MSKDLAEVIVVILCTTVVFIALIDLSVHYIKRAKASAPMGKRTRALLEMLGAAVVGLGLGFLANACLFPELFTGL